MPRLRSAAAVLLFIAAAARAEITLEGGTCFPLRAGESWAEAWVEVHNSGPGEFRGTVEAEFQMRSRRGPGTTREVQLAPGVRKRYSLLLGQAGLWIGGLEFRVRGADGTVVARVSKEQNWRSAKDRGIAVFQGEGALPGLLAPFQAPKPVPTGIALHAVKAGQLPEYAEGWAHVNVVILRGADLGAMTAGQRAALLGWVGDGGQVLVLPGADVGWLADPWLQQLAPTGAVTDRGPADRLSGILGDAVPPRTLGFATPGEPLIPHWGPLVTFYRRGLGRVAVAAFDADDPVFRTPGDGVPAAEFQRKVESVATEILKRLESRSLATLEHPASRGGHRWYVLSRLLGVGVIRYPATWIVGLVLIAYIALVGPAALLFLRRRHRPALAVVLLPLLGVATTATLLFAGRAFGEREVLGGRVTVVRPMEGTDEALAIETVVLVSPRRGVLAVNSGAGRVAAIADGRGVVDESAVMGGPDGEQLMRSCEGREPAWFAASGRRKLGALSVTKRDGELVVVNETEYVLESARVVGSGRLLLPDIAAGATQRTRLPVPLPSHWERRSVFDAAGAEREALLRDAILESVAPAFFETTGDAFVALVRRPGPPVRVNGREQELETDLTVIVVPLAEAPR